MGWLEFVRALRELAGSRKPIHVVMAHDETLVLIDRPHGKGRRVRAARRRALKDVRWMTSKTGATGLRVVVRGGYPISTLTQT